MTRHRRVISGRDGVPIPRPRDECPSRKFGWSFARDAELALERARERHGGDGAKLPVRWYGCDRCTSYHLTSRETWEDVDDEADDLAA